MKSLTKTYTPQLALSTAVLISALLAWICIVLVTSTPWIGVSLSTLNDRVVVEKVFSNSPATEKLFAGDQFIAIKSNKDARVAISTSTIIEEPDMLPEYGIYNEFMQQQTQLFDLLNLKTITIETNRGDIDLSPIPRPIWSLPFVFWFQIICGLIAFITGLSIFVFRSGQASSRIYALSGFMFLVITFTAAIYSSRELALNGELFRQLSILDHFGAMIFAGAFVGLLWLYPARLGSLNVIYILLSVYFLTWVLDTLQLLPNTDWGIRIPMIGGLCLSILFAIRQWRYSYQKALERAALKWFLFSLYLSGATFVVTIFVTVWLGLPPPMSQGYAFGVVTIMYLGVAVGITRYRLFNLERWWFKVWVWFFAGVMVITMDMLFVYVLQFTQQLALAISLALTGWFYFPARQWIFSRIMPANDERLENMFPQLLRIGLNAAKPELLDQDWRSLLEKTFSPLEISTLKHTVSHPQLINNGQGMEIPGLGQPFSIQLYHPFGGNRLFSPDDVKLVEGILKLAGKAVEDHLSYEKGAINERERISRDLHDDLGAKILSLIHLSPDNTQRQIAKEAMSDLRETLNNLEEKPQRLVLLFGNIRQETEARLQQREINLDWRDNIEIDNTMVPARFVTNLKHAIREIITNALKHSHPTNICISICLDNDLIRITISQDGVLIAPENWSDGRGTKHLQTRISEINGTVEAYLQKDNLTTEIQLALPQNKDQLIPPCSGDTKNSSTP